MGIVFGYLSLICFCMLVATQKIDVDAVSGATNSSNVIKKAIENAVAQ